MWQGKGEAGGGGGNLTFLDVEFATHRGFPMRPRGSGGRGFVVQQTVAGLQVLSCSVGYKSGNATSTRRPVVLGDISQDAHLSP